MSNLLLSRRCVWWVIAFIEEHSTQILGEQIRGNDLLQPCGSSAV